MSEAELPEGVRAWMQAPPGRLLGRGHPAGDFLEAYDWDVLDERDGRLELRCALPDQVKNPRGQLFGGFTPTYVDLIGLRTVGAGRRLLPDGTPRPRSWLATTSMQLDYFEPIIGPTFVVRGEVEKRRGRTVFVVVRFFQDDVLAVHARLTAREMRMDRPLGDA